MSQLATVEGASTNLVPNAPIGTEMAEGFLDGIESDMAVALHQRQFRAARVRLNSINAEFAKLVEDLKARYSEPEAALATLYVEGCREELLACYLNVNRKVAVQEGRKKIAELVDGLIASTIANLKALKPEAIKIETPAEAPTKRGRQGKN